MDGVTKGKGRESSEHHMPQGSCYGTDPKIAPWIWLLVSTDVLYQNDLGWTKVRTTQGKKYNLLFKDLSENGRRDTGQSSKREEKNPICV